MSTTPEPLDIFQVETEFSAVSSTGYSPTGRVRGLLECGHWSAWHSEASSQWEFPHELVNCPEGHGLVHFHPALVAELERGLA